MKVLGEYLVFAWMMITSSTISVAQIEEESLKTSIDKARTFLESHQFESGAFQDSTRVLFNVWETILVCNALLDDPNKNDSIVQAGLAWLKQYENPQGIICHNASCASAYCIETSSLYLQLLHQVNPKRDFSAQLKTIEGLQEKNGSWAIGNPDVVYDVYYPSVTAFTVNLFEALNHEFSGTKVALQYIAQKQQKLGSWGQNWEYYGAPGYAIWQCIPALKTDSIYRATWEKALAFVVNTQLEDGSWNFSIGDSTNHISTELHTAFMLQVLANETTESTLDALEKGLNFLIKKQQANGCWDGGLFPIPNQRYRKNEYLIATALAYQSLVHYQQFNKDE